MDEQTELIFWDVQHGHSTFIKTPKNRAIFIDLGIGSAINNNQRFSPILHSLKRNRITRIERLIITHPHLDHIDDIHSISNRQVGQLHYPDGIDPDMLINKSQQQFKKKVLSSSDHLTVQKFVKYKDVVSSHSPMKSRRSSFSCDGVRFTLFRAKQQNGANLNNMSILTVVEYLDWKFVIPGDNEHNSFEEMFDIDGFEECISDAEILLAPHHGRKNGIHDKFLSTVNPDIVVISDSRWHRTSCPNDYRKFADGQYCYHRRTESPNWRNVLSTHGDGVIVVRCGIQQNQEYFEINYG